MKCSIEKKVEKINNDGLNISQINRKTNFALKSFLNDCIDLNSHLFIKINAVNLALIN